MLEAATATTIMITPSHWKGANPYVITGQIEGQHLTDMQRPRRRLRKRAGLDDVRIHDLRHSFASDALQLGEDLPMIGKLLGHTQVQTTARYAHLKTDPIRAAADEVADAIALSRSPKEDGSVAALERPDWKGHASANRSIG